MFSQSETGQQAIELHESQEWDKLRELTENQLDIDTSDAFNTLLFKYYRTRAIASSGTIMQSFIETEKIFNDYNDASLIDTPMVKMMLNVCQKLSYEALESQKIKISLDAVKRGIELCTTRLSDDHYRMSDNCYSAASIYRSLDSIDMALMFVKKGKEAAGHLEGKEKRLQISKLRNEEAILYWSQNNLKMTKSIFTEELQQAIKDTNYTLQTRFHTNLGITNEFLFDFGKAEYHFMKALETNLLKDERRELDEYLITTNLARIYKNQSKYDKAEELLQKSLVLTKKIYGENSPRFGGTYLALGNIYAKQKKYSKARFYYDKDLEIVSRHHSKKSIKYTDKLIDYGATLILENKLDEGIEYVLRGLQNREKLDLKFDKMLSNSYKHMTLAYLRKNDLPKAKEYSEKSIEALEFDLSNLQYNFDKLDVPNKLIGPLYMRYEYLNAIACSQETFQEYDVIDQVTKLDNVVDSLVRYIKFNFEDLESRKSFVNDMQPLYQSRLELYDRLYKDNKEVIEKAFDLSERTNNTFLYEAEAEKENNLNALTNEIYNQRQKQKNVINTTKSKIAKYLIETEEKDQQIVDSLKYILTSTQQEHYQLIQKIKEKNPGYYSYVYDYPIATIGDVQKALKEDEILVEFVSSTNDQLAITISKEGQNLYNLGSMDTLHKALREYIDYCKNPQAKAELKYDLSKMLIEPLKLTKEKIHFVLDDLLAMIPMETLLDKEGKPLLINHLITYNYSATLMSAKQKKKHSSGGILAMAPVFNDDSEKIEEPGAQYYAEVIRSGNIIPLLGSLKEVEIINNIFGGEMFIEKNATRSTFLSNASDKNIIHLATHGIINEIEPSLSGLIFNSENGETEELLVSDIIQLDLNADLVTLSACNTGSGKIVSGEGVASLGRAFSYAGCRNQILSLWAVHDKTTTELMTNLYNNLKEGQSKPTALKNAKLQYLETAPDLLKHPYYWAGFVYYGDDTPIILQSKFGIWAAFAVGGMVILFFGFYYRSKTSNSRNNHSIQ